MHYRFYLLDQDGNIKAAETFSSPDDSTAQKQLIWFMMHATMHLKAMSFAGEANASPDAAVGSMQQDFRI
jgi:hypothetical protein